MGKILVTGGTGFIGSHLVELLIKEGYDVVVYDRYNPNNDWGWLENSDFKNDLEVILGDIRDFDSVLRATKKVDTILHLAALIGIPYSYISPLAYIRTNIEGTYNVLEAARQKSIDNLIITSTSETYGSAQFTPIDESHPKVGQSPYSASKIAADQLALSYFKSFDLPVKIIRPFNTFGPRQSLRAIIPTIISQIKSGEKEIKLGNLSPTRDLTYVIDTCWGFIEIMNSPEVIGEEVNLGMDEEISIKDLTSLINQLLGKEVKVVQEENRVRPSASEVERLRCNNKKITELTNWKPKFNIKEGLKLTIDWFSKDENLQRFKSTNFNV